MIFAITFALLILVLGSIIYFAPRPTLDPTPPAPKVPEGIDPNELAGWLEDREKRLGNIIDGAEATIVWSDKPAATDLCLVYIHGFSASRQETAPMTDRIAEQMGANLVYTRLAGHGLHTDAMNVPAEAWLQSMVDAWEIATRIGRKVVFVATSTGAPLALWLSHHLPEPRRVHAFVFLSPNFKIRSPFDFLLTWPGSKRWIPWILGKERYWEPENEMVGRYWTNRYSMHSVIEMQKVVDWAKRTSFDSTNIPLATLYMEDDPTINHQAAIDFHHTWDADHKQLHQVTIDADNPQHVFVGDITAPHRTDWCVETCLQFLRSIPVDRS